MRRQHWLRAAQVIATTFLIWLLFRDLQWAELQTLAAQLQWSFVLLGALFILGSHLINVMRWHYLVQGRAVGYGTLLLAYGAGLFSNNFLPSGVGGDGVRIALLSRYLPLHSALLSVVLDRLSGVIALSALLLPGLWLGLPPGLTFDVTALANDRSDVLLTAVIVLAGVSFLGLLFRHRLPAPRTAWHWLSPDSPLTDAAAHRPRRSLLQLLLISYLLSALSQFALVAAHWSVLQALALEPSPAPAIWLVLAGTLALLLPIAVNGLGLLEGSYVLLLGQYGISSTSALGVALLIRALILGFSLLGGLISIAWKAEPSLSQEPRPARTKPKHIS